MYNDTSLNKIKSAAVEVELHKRKLKRYQKVFQNTPQKFEFARERLKNRILTTNTKIKEAQSLHRKLEIQMEEELEVA